jgi:signal transduction histidine kinase
VKSIQPTLRLRMALLYGGLVLLVGAAVLFTAAVLVDRTIAGLTVFQLGPQIVVLDPSGTPINVNTRDLRAASTSQARDQLLHAGLLYFAIIVVIGSIGGYVLARQTLRPIARVTQTARRLSTDTLSDRINLGGPHDELRELADTFDDMLSRLAAAFESQRRFVANASHELRTPLAVMRTEVDVALASPDTSNEELRQMGEVVRDATMRAERLVDSLLVLARLQSRTNEQLEVHEAVDLAVLVPVALAAVATEAADRGIQIDLQLSRSVVVGDPRLLERLVGNLVENAVRHNVVNGWIQVRSSMTPAGVEFEVANGGAVIEPATELDALFEAFRRGTRARTGPRGSGLGLSIVTMIVTAHAGQLRAEAPPEGGLRVCVVLPVTADATMPLPAAIGQR